VGTVLNTQQYTVSIDDHESITEGDGADQIVTFTVSLDLAGEVDVTIPYTIDLTESPAATDGADFVVSAGSVVIPAGNDTALIPVTIKADTITEYNEVFNIVLGAVVGPGTVDPANGEGRGVILNDDNYTITIDNALGVPEGNSGDTNTAVFTVTLSGAGEATVDVPYGIAPDLGLYPATIGTDVDDLPGPPAPTVALTGDGDTATINITVNGDDEVEAPLEMFWVNLRLTGLPIDAGGSDIDGLGTIADNDSYTITIGDSTVAGEGDSGITQAAFTVTLSGLGSWPVDVPYALAAGATNPVIIGTDVADLPGPPAPTVTLNGAGATETIFIDVNGDTRVEFNETFNVNLDLTGLPIAVAGSDTEALGTITDDDQYTIAINGDGSVLEPDAAATVDHIFTVNLVGDGDVPVSVPFSVVGGALPAATIAAGDDIEPNTNTLAFAGGPANLPVTLTVNGDDTVEQDETFKLTLGAIVGPVNLGASDTEGDGTITNNDQYTLSIDDLPAITEGDSGSTTATFTVSLDQAGGQDVSVAYSVAGDTATLGDDFNAVDGSVTIAAGDTSATIDVTINGDTRVEIDETFNITLGAVTGPGVVSATDNIGTGTIANTDRYTISIADNNAINEDTGLDTIGQLIVSLNEAGDLPVTVAYSATGVTASEGPDFEAPDSTVTISAGDTSATIDVTIKGDTRVEASETFTVSLGTVTGEGDVSGAAGTATGTILDNDNYTIAVAPQPNITEGDAGSSPVQFSVTLDQAGDLPVSVAWTVSGDTATEGTDFSAADGTLNFAPNDTVKTIDVTINGDTITETDEIFYVTLGTVTGPGALSLANGEAAGTILNDDQYTISIADITSISEGDAGSTTATFTVSLDQAGEDGVDVAYTVAGVSADEGTDFDAPDNSLVFAAGETSKTIDVTIYGDSRVEVDETFDIVLGGVTGSGALSGTDNVGTGTIINDDNYTLTIVGDGSTSEPDAPATATHTFTVNLVGAGDVPVSMPYSIVGGPVPAATILAGDDIEPNASTLAFTGGDESLPVNVIVNGDDRVENDESFKLVLGAITGPVDLVTADTEADGTIVNDDQYTLTVSDNLGIVEGDADHDVNFDISVDQAGDVDVTVAFMLMDWWDWPTVGTTLGLDYLEPAVLQATIPAGQTKATVPITIIGDTLVEHDEEFRIQLTMVLSGPGVISAVKDYGTGHILQEEIYQVTIKDQPVIVEGNSPDVNWAYFEIELDKPGEAFIEISYSMASGSATKDVDFQPDYNMAPPPDIWPAWADGFMGGGQLWFQIQGDNIPEIDEKFTVTLESINGPAVFGPKFVAEGTIINDDDYMLTIIDSAAIAEGDSGTTVQGFAVSVDQPGEVDVAVDYAVTGGTAADGTDYVLPAGPITIPAGATSASIDVTVNGDVIVENNETFEITLNTVSSGPGTISATDNVAIGTILNDDNYVVSIDDETDIVEGNSGGWAKPFTVRLDSAGEADLTVAYSATGLTAVQGIDFFRPADSVTIPAGDTSITFDVGIMGESIVENDETFEIALGAVTGPGIVSATDGVGSGTIKNDDFYTIGIADIGSIAEGDAGSTTETFTVSIDQAGEVDVTIDYTVDGGSALEDTDFSAADGSVTIPAGDTTASIDVTIFGDTDVEQNETFDINLGLVSGAAGVVGIENVGTGTIVNDDSYAVSIADEPAIAEGNSGTSPAAFTVSLDRAGEQDVTVNYSVLAGTATDTVDMTAATGSIVIAAGATSGTINVDIIGDTVVENDETFAVQIDSISGPGMVPTPADGEALGTILNDDSFEIAIDSISVSEADAKATFTVSVVQAGDIDVSVDFATGDAGDTATADADYTSASGVALIAAGTSSTTIEIDLLDDTLYELDETFTVALGAITGAPGAYTAGKDKGIGTISDDGDTYEVYLVEPLQVVTEGTDASVTFTIALDQALPEDISVPFIISDGSAENGDDYLVPAAPVSPVVFTAGETSKAITIDIVDDDLYENQEDFNITIGNPAYGNNTLGNVYSECDINDDGVDTYQATLSGGTTVAESAGTVTLTVDLDQPVPGGATVGIDLAGSAILGAGLDYIITPSGLDLVFNDTETSKTITLDINDDTLYELTETIEVGLSPDTNGTTDGSPQIVSITNDDTFAFAISGPNSVNEADGTATFTVTLDQMVPGGTSIDLVAAGSGANPATLGADLSFSPTTVVFSDSEISQTVVVVILDDALVEAPEEFDMTATTTDPNADPTPFNYTCAIISGDGYVLDIGDVTVDEDGSTAFISVYIAPAVAAGDSLTFDYATADGTALDGTDYTATSGSIAVLPGNDTVSIGIPILDNNLDTADRQFTVTISNNNSVPPNASLINDATGTCTINDNDVTVTFLVDGNGNVSGANPFVQVVNIGESVSDGVAEPDPNHFLFNWSGDFTGDHTVSLVSLGSVIESKTIVAHFKEKPKVRTIVDPDVDLVDVFHGEISPGGSGDNWVHMDYLSDNTFTIAAENSYCIGNVSIDGTSYGALEEHTFTSVDRLSPSYYEVHATFRDRFTLTGQVDPLNARDGSGGSGTWRVIDTATNGVDYNSGWLTHNEIVEVPCDIYEVNVEFSPQTGWETPATQTLSLTEDYTVVGWYRPILTITSANGLVTSSDTLISCPDGADCTETYDYNTKVTLTATADDTFVFSNWDVDLAGSSPVASFFMDQPRNITAVYEGLTPDNADLDGDGWSKNDGDCDDADDTIYPTAKELCDGVDHDCDGLRNDTDPIDPDCEDAELGLANLPLDTLLQPAPATIMFVMDDSGSMDFEFSNPAGPNEDWNERDYLWDDDKPGQDNTYKSSYRYLPDADRGYWRTQWSDHNTLYYNPQIEYLPWKKDDGSRYNFADLDSSGTSIWPKAYQDPNKHEDNYSLDLTDVFWTLGDSSGDDADFDTDAVIIDSHKASPGTFVLDDNSKWRVDNNHGEGYDRNFYDTAIPANGNNGNTRRATWTPNALPEGYYDVYAWWRDIGNYATSVKYVIHHKDTVGGVKTTTDIYVNQEQNSRRWNRLGDTSVWIDATTDPKVVLEHYVTNGGNHACADAVAFLRVGGAADPNVYNAHYYVTINTKKLDINGDVIYDDEGNIVYETDANGVPIPESIYLVNLDDSVKYNKVTVNGSGFVTGLELITDPADVPEEIKVPVRSAEIYDYTDPTDAVEQWQAERRNFSNWYSYYRRRELTAKAAVGEVISGLRGVRVGFKYINGKGQSNKTVPPKAVRVTTLDLETGEELMENDDNLLADFYDFNSNGGTPLLQGLYDVGRFFDQNDKSTGGIGNDKNGPWYMPEGGKSRGGECQQAFAILFTDGYYNGGKPSDDPTDPKDNVGNNDGDNTTPVDTTPLAGHGNYLFADNWDSTLGDIAMKYYETDLSPSLEDDVPSSDKDYDDAKHQHMVTYSVSFGLNGTLDQDEYDLYNDSPDLIKYPKWPDPLSKEDHKIDDMWHAAVNGRGQYMSAQNPEELISSMTEIMDNLISRIGSGSSLSINGEELNTGTIMFQASYSTDGWEGDVKAYNVDHKTGMVDTNSPVWSASSELDKLDWDVRQIATYNPASGRLDPDRKGIAFQWDDLTGGQQVFLKDNPLLKDLQDQGDTIGRDRLEFLRGNHAKENKFSGGTMRSRNSKLGDIVHSAPFYVDYIREVVIDGDTTYEPYGMLYVSANDGMLHAFRSTDGKELFGYVPNLVVENLGHLTLPEPYFRHRYYVDRTVHIREVGHKELGVFNSEKLLVGGLGKGGKGYFCLDVTNPEDNTEANADTWVKWEFPHADTDPAVLANLGYAYSEAYIVKSNIPTDPFDPNDRWRWVVVFGNGYASANGSAVLYVVDAKTGELLREIDTGAVGGNGMSTPTPIDINGDYRLDYVYVGDLQGNVWKFDMTDADPDNWDSAYFDIDTGDRVPLFTAIARERDPDGTYPTDGETWRQPITAKINVMRHCEATQNGYLVMFGTGKSLSTADLEDTHYQTIYGIWDYGANSTQYVGSFMRGATRELENLDTTATLLEQTVEYEDDLVRVLTDHTPTWETDNMGKPISHAGWFFDLPLSKERIVKTATLRGGKLIIISSIPETDPCSAGGSSVVHEMDACSGGRLEQAQFDINDDGVIDENDYIVIKKIDPDTGKEVEIYLAPTGLKFDAMIHPPIIIETPGGETERKYFSTAAGNISTMEEQSEVKGMFFWRMLER